MVERVYNLSHQPLNSTTASTGSTLRHFVWILPHIRTLQKILCERMCSRNYMWKRQPSLLLPTADPSENVAQHKSRCNPQLMLSPLPYLLHPYPGQTMEVNSPPTTICNRTGFGVGVDCTCFNSTVTSTSCDYESWRANKVHWRELPQALWWAQPPPPSLTSHNRCYSTPEGSPCQRLTTNSYASRSCQPLEAHESLLEKECYHRAHLT